MDLDSAVGVATRYGLDGPGIESRWGQDFPHSSRPALETIPPPVQGVPDLFPWGKATEVKERVQLYLVIHLWAFVACYMVNFTFSVYFQ
jgi:hypothetical protein